MLETIALILLGAASVLAPWVWIDSRRNAKLTRNDDNGRATNMTTQPVFQPPRGLLGGGPVGTPSQTRIVGPQPDDEWPLPTDAEIAMQMAYMPNVASGHIIAWKGWSLANGYLQGMFGAAWTPNTPYVGVNMADNHMKGAGIHAAKEDNAEVRHHRVYGQVALWGHVIEHEHGYRARYAYPVKLYVQGAREEADALAKRYGVERVRSGRGC